MAVPIQQRGQQSSQAAFEQRIARLRASPEERAQLLATGRPFDYEAWQQEAGRASADELTEMEQLLRERDVERLVRQASDGSGRTR